MQMLSFYCQSLNLKYKHMKSIINSPYMDKINNNFIGWPCVEELGGYSIDDKLNPNRSLDFQIAENDPHPNSKGHEMIANFLYDKLYRL